MNEDTYLAHHGIKGMKWGVRRFQNPDGTRTSLGKRREKNLRREKTHEELLNSTSAQELYKNKDKLSDRELQERINRIRNEQALKQLADYERQTAKNGKSMTKKILGKLGEKTAEAIAAGIVAATVIPAVKKVTKKGSDISMDWINFLFKDQEYDFIFDY